MHNTGRVKHYRKWWFYQGTASSKR